MNGNKIENRSADESMEHVQRANRYVALVAHELRDPLLPIITAAALLKRSPHDAALVERSAGVIDRQARVLNRRIDDLLDVSRLQMGKLRLARTRTSIAKVLAQCMETVAPTVRLRGQTLLVSVSPDPMELEVDDARLGQVLHNLISNAVKFSEPGTELRVHAERDGGNALVTVVDSGVGLSATQLESIFELFAQADEVSPTRPSSGLGIGLYLARLIAEAHGGSVVATSEGLGRGSTFSLRVPVVSPETFSMRPGQAFPSSRSVSFFTTA